MDQQRDGCHDHHHRDCKRVEMEGNRIIANVTGLRKPVIGENLNTTTLLECSITQRDKEQDPGINSGEKHNADTDITAYNSSC